MNNMFFKKMISLFLILTLTLSLAACGKDDDEKQTLTDKEKKYVTSAVDLVRKEWKNTFSTNAGRSQFADIVGTRLILIKDNKIDDFKDVEAIVEFNIMTGPYGNVSYYTTANRDNMVVFYKDGTHRLFNILRAYMAKTYDNKFGGVIDKVIDLGSEFNTEDITVKEPGEGEDKYVKQAKEALKTEWTKLYKDKKDCDDYTLNIVNTQLLKFHSSSSYADFKKYFKNVSVIVEFEINTNYYDTAPYYMYTNVTNNVIIYKDGKTKVVNRYINNIADKTYSYDFNGAFETISLGSKYNENIQLKK